MWWLLIVIVILLAVMVAMIVALNRRGEGDPSYRPNDAHSGEQLGGPSGQWGPGDGGGF